MGHHTWTHFTNIYASHCVKEILKFMYNCRADNIIHENKSICTTATRIWTSLYYITFHCSNGFLHFPPLISLIPQETDRTILVGQNKQRYEGLRNETGQLCMWISLYSIMFPRGWITATLLGYVTTGFIIPHTWLFLTSWFTKSAEDRTEQRLNYSYM